ncbi:hypothetical protein OG874_14130 [Nocardia sp. NBC_00565]|uniref:hypothetical protein n=1 Tax=Nocardia sp. NBC_00565 TaxID=2975993 RepID=UPI002E8041AD|nr:hypothetical protein [Nocardia sp. NBC_00565]WUC06199.1 hypothetical protein OG874_14130 [Nocardia sp. NBC_00565]
MAFQLELQPAPPLHLTPECVVHTGTVRLFVTGMLSQTAGAPAEQFGFFLPNTRPIEAGAPEPRLWAEMHLMTAASGDFPFGVVHAQVAYVPDPRDVLHRWLHLTAAAHPAHEVRLGYRVTVQSR